MKRIFIEKLKEWSNKPNRRPLVLSGARQVGKTWLLREFGRTCYDRVAYVNLERSPELRALFEGAFDFRRILTGLQAASGVSITPGDTLVIIDEIQLCGAALTGLKYWQEEHNEYHVATAGSLVGLALMGGTGYPVGKTNSMTLYPMSFGEFLIAVGEEKLFDIASGGDAVMINSFADKLRDLLKTYYFVGGMPAAVAAYADSLSLDAAREEQSEILADYARDFSRHAPSRDVPRIRAIWNSLPVQLAKTDKRFVAGDVSNASSGKTRSRDLKDPFEWLEAAGVAYRVWNVAKPNLPLDGYRNHLFKLFSVDVGLLGAASKLPPSAILDGGSVFTEFKGALTEQYVQQELRTLGITPHYWTTPESNAEVDFVVELNGAVIPIEAKAAVNLQSKSLAAYRNRFEPPISVRASMAPMKRESWLLNLPLYALSSLVVATR